MRIPHRPPFFTGRWSPGALIFTLLAYCAAGLAADPSTQTLVGADNCVVCHGAGMPKSAVAIFDTPHGSQIDPASPFAQQQCEQCHGPAVEHASAQSRGEDLLPTVVFGQAAKTPVPEQNQQCLQCHESHSRSAWAGSAHESAEVSCAACHSIHASEDRVFDPQEQQQTCFNCHKKRRGDVNKPSAHPLKYGKMSCSSCHDPHNGDNEFLLTEASVNDTCYTCHAEKRGPFLWEHAPAAEDCSACHQVHGSNHAPMLVKRPPLLCQQCHSPAGHPSFALTADDVDDSFRNRFQLARGCLNCHSKVHGSNHPSGATLHR